MENSLTGLTDALNQMLVPFGVTSGPSLASYGITEFWQYLVLVSLPVFGYLVLDWSTKKCR